MADQIDHFELVSVSPIVELIALGDTGFESGMTECGNILDRPRFEKNYRYKQISSISGVAVFQSGKVTTYVRRDLESQHSSRPALL